jgi:ABC-type uncharacterized transport system permease subunit
LSAQGRRPAHRRIALHGHGWGTIAWAVVAGWTILLTLVAGLAYRRDSGRV